MRLVTFVEGDKAARPGLVVDGGVVDLGAEGFEDAIAFMGAPGSVQAEAARAAARSRTRIALEKVRLLAPVPNPPRIFGIGVNYAEHAAESGTRMRDVPTVFMVLSSAVVGPGAEVVLPPNSAMVDYEAELAVVIGKAGHRIAASEWEEHVFGYTIMNDVSARDVQRATSQWSLGEELSDVCADGAVGGDEGRDRRSASVGDFADDWRGEVAGLEYEPDDLQDSGADRVPVGDCAARRWAM